MPERIEPMCVPTTAIVCCAVSVALLGCGEQRSEPPIPLRASGAAYRALTTDERLAVARSCRDRAVANAHGTAARQLRQVDSQALRTRLDDAFAVTTERHRSVADVCRERLPLVTPGLRLSFDGAKPFGDDAFTFETSSDKLLTIRGHVSPAPNRGRVIARREGERSPAWRAAIAPDGRFALPSLHLRKQADNTFTLTIQAPPNAARTVYFSALCLDCLAGAPPPSPPP